MVLQQSFHTNPEEFLVNNRESINGTKLPADMGRLHLSETRLLIGPPPGPDPSEPRGVPAVLNILPTMRRGRTC